MIAKMSPVQAGRILEVIATALPTEADKQLIVLDKEPAVAFTEACRAQGISLAQTAGVESREERTATGLQQLFGGEPVLGNNELIPIRVRAGGNGLVIHVDYLQTLAARVKHGGMEHGV